MSNQQEIQRILEIILELKDKKANLIFNKASKKEIEDIERNIFRYEAML